MCIRDRVGDDLESNPLDAATRAAVIAILPAVKRVGPFRAGLRCAVNTARELTQLRRRVFEDANWIPETDESSTPAVGPGNSLERLEAQGAEDCTRDTDLKKMRDRLALATADGAFELFYQPKVNAGTRAVVGFEALVRWDDPVCGRVPPDVFIPLAEEMGLIERIGDWCIREACARIAHWNELGLDPGRVAVNASPVQFQRADFATRLIDTVVDAGVELRQFELEITEGCLIESDEAIATLVQLSDAGIQIAVDDFGTGYSSLQYLRSLPVHCLKIDRVFVTEIEHDASARSLTAAIISLAWNLGFRVVAEGVEDDFQWGFLADHGCDEIQGFHFSRPLSSGDAEQLLREEKVRSDLD